MAMTAKCRHVWEHIIFKGGRFNMRWSCCQRCKTVRRTPEHK